MNTCFNCGRELTPSDGTHVSACARKNGIEKKDARKLQIDHNVGFEITQEFMKKHYVDEQMSLPDMQKNFGLAYKQTEALLEYFNIPKRDAKAGCKIGAKKYKKTLQEKYGVDNVSQLAHVKEKKKETFIQNYGVDNIFKNAEFKIHQEKVMIEKYGKRSITSPGNKMSHLSEERKQKIYMAMREGFKRWVDNMNDDERNSHFKNCGIKGLQALTKISKLELRIQSLLNALGVEYIAQFQVGFNAFDIRLANTNIIIEVNGDFWHANPIKYKSDDILTFPMPPGRKTAEEVWKKDARKNDYATKKGYNIIIIWESEMKSLSDEDLTGLLLERIRSCQELPQSNESQN